MTRSRRHVGRWLGLGAVAAVVVGVILLLAVDASEKTIPLLLVVSPTTAHGNEPIGVKLVNRSSSLVFYREGPVSVSSRTSAGFKTPQCSYYADDTINPHSVLSLPTIPAQRAGRYWVWINYQYQGSAARWHFAHAELTVLR